MFRCAQKMAFLTIWPHKGGVEGSNTKVFFAGTCMKFPDIHRKIMFLTAIPWGWVQVPMLVLLGIE